MERITQSQIARKAGVNVATVSRALGGDARISAETTTRVREIAAQLGYRPDPVLSSIAASRWRGERELRVNLAYISQSRQTHNRNQKGRQGAETRADELGYKLDQFILADYPDSTALQQVLVARGIRGLIIGPFFNPDPLINLDWNKFCAVGCGHGHYEPQIHTVRHDPYEAVLVAWQHVLTNGYRRPGLIISEHCRPMYVDDDDCRRAAARLCYDRCPTDNRVPPLFCSLADPHDAMAKSITAWYRKWKPDAVIGLNGFITQLLQNAGKVKVPSQVGFAALSVFSSEKGMSGIKDSPEDVGSASVDLLQQTLFTNQWGLPRIRIQHYLEPEWIDGDTLPKK